MIWLCVSGILDRAVSLCESWPIDINESPVYISICYKPAVLQMGSFQMSFIIWFLRMFLITIATQEQGWEKLLFVNYCLKYVRCKYVESHT